MIKYLFLILSILFSFYSLAQEKTFIKMEKQSGIDKFGVTLSPTMRYTGNKLFKVPENIEDYIIKYREFTVNTNEFENAKPLKVFFLVGTFNDSLIIIVDANGNNDFIDEEKLIYPKNKSEADISQLPIVKTRIALHNGIRDFYIQPTPYRQGFEYNDDLEKKHYLLIRLGEHLVGALPGQKEITVFKAANIKISPLYLAETLKVLIYNGDQGHKLYNIGELFWIKDQRYILDSISAIGDFLVIRKLKDLDLAKDNGYSKGLFLRPFTALDLDGRQVEFPTKQLTLIDFWGTWCRPCLELTPQLKSIHSKYSPKLLMVGVAYDDKKDKVKAYILSKSMSWTHIMDPQDVPQSNPVIKNFKIESYPTFILIDETGKIIFRGEGKSALDEVENILQQYKFNN